jgi:hypothetical protein
MQVRQVIRLRQLRQLAQIILEILLGKSRQLILVKQVANILVTFTPFRIWQLEREAKEGLTNGLGDSPTDELKMSPKESQAKRSRLIQFKLG